jgi:Na+-translocating ferredoxin:NAD+ oxidoreductase RNF subunit RnfB
MINILGAVLLTVALLLGFLWCMVRLHGGIAGRSTLAGPAVERINKLLPQTQCGQCGYAGCLPYAQAIAAGEARLSDVWLNFWICHRCLWMSPTAGICQSALR